MLWILSSDPDDLSAEYQLALDALAGGNVPTSESAQAAAINIRLSSGGLLAEEAVEVVSLLQMGADFPGFATSGDLIWVIRFSLVHSGVTQEMWINSQTGAIRSMLPLR